MHNHLDQNKRYQIYALLKSGSSQRETARIIGVSHSTVSRELKRNSGGKGYRPVQAQRMAEERQREASKRRGRRCNPKLRPIALELVSEKNWSPCQIEGALKTGRVPEAQGLGTVSHETIYRWIIEDRKAGGEAYKGLRRRRKKYNRRIRPNAGRGLIPARRDIDERPAAVALREEFGHWEIDTVVGKANRGQVIVTAVERDTRMFLARRSPSRKAEDVASVLLGMLEPFKGSVITLTFDNGKEFAKHKEIDAALGCVSYFAHPYHSWERGSNEHHNGLLRQFIRKGTPIETYSDEEIKAAVDNINSRPMALHGYDTPGERFEKRISSRPPERVATQPPCQARSV